MSQPKIVFCENMSPSCVVQQKIHWWTDINGNELKINLNQFSNHALRFSHIPTATSSARWAYENNKALKWHFCTLAAAQIEHNGKAKWIIGWDFKDKYPQVIVRRGCNKLHVCLHSMIQLQSNLLRKLHPP